jgi:RNA polymerase sigma-70 factor, ECF subfamily
MTKASGPDMTDVSDDALVALAAAGDRSAFTDLVERHQGRLLALMTRTLGARTAAEDIVQEVFTRAWLNAPRWRAQGLGRPSYAAWLSRVALNLAIDQARKGKAVPLDGIAEPSDPAPLPDATMLASERAERLRSAIAALPERQRTALALTYDAELSNADGAAAMETSVGAFELLLVRARRTLRTALRDA